MWNAVSTCAERAVKAGQAHQLGELVDVTGTARVAVDFLEQDEIGVRRPDHRCDTVEVVDARGIFSRVNVVDEDAQLRIARRQGGRAGGQREKKSEPDAQHLAANSRRAGSRASARALNATFSNAGGQHDAGRPRVQTTRRKGEFSHG